MSRVSPSQMKKLLELLSEDGILHHGRVLYTNTNKQTFWKRIATQLNSVEGGVYKNTWKWCKMWADWKNKTKKKANILLRRKNYNIEHPPSTLTNLELRLLKLIDYPLDERPETLQQLTVNKIEAENLAGDDENHLNNDCDSTDIAGAHYQGYTAESKFCSVEDFLNEEGLNGKTESSDSERKIKLKGKSHKKKKISFQEYKAKTIMALQKEKSYQKTEELRLKALELKLKGDELRLKEMEMNKVNYLTNIEEEKLKCLRDISSSLREFLERSRNENVRFNVI